MSISITCGCSLNRHVMLHPALAQVPVGRAAGYAGDCVQERSAAAVRVHAARGGRKPRLLAQDAEGAPGNRRPPARQGQSPLPGPCTTTPGKRGPCIKQHAAERCAHIQGFHAEQASGFQVAAVDADGDEVSKGAVATKQPTERVSFHPSAAANASPAPLKAADSKVNGGDGSGSGADAPAKPPLAAKIQKEVSAPLAGVQTALVLDVALWEHTKTFRSLSRGLYVIPKVPHPSLWRACAYQQGLDRSAQSLRRLRRCLSCALHLADELLQFSTACANDCRCQPQLLNGHCPRMRIGLHCALPAMRCLSVVSVRRCDALCGRAGGAHDNAGAAGADRPPLGPGHGPLLRYVPARLVPACSDRAG